jgi:hypothetical protein
MTNRSQWGKGVGLAGAALLGMVVLAPAQDDEEIQLNHSECALFGADRDANAFGAMKRSSRYQYPLSELTHAVAGKLSAPRYAFSAEVAAPEREADPQGLIDRHIFNAIRDAGATPAGKTNDYEFARRVTLDLTGRPVTLERLQQFVDDRTADKRTRYVNELLDKPEWVDRWALYFGDLVKNVDNNTQVNRFPQGRNAFHFFIKKSLEANKRYNTLVTEMLTATGDNSYQQGELNWIVGGRVVGGPAQDIYDQLAVNAATQFLGLAHENCVMCHDGRRHLDSLSVWGKFETRREAWQLASFFSRVTLRQVRVDPTMPNPYYWAVVENPRAADYALNTTSGNRPPRQPIGTIRNVTPDYPFGDGGKPGAGEAYRAALARYLTNDIQFSRAIVNYLWKEFFGRGIVEPVNMFDPDRLDPKNMPPEPWTLQPTHPGLLEELAQDFKSNGFDLKDLMRKIVNSEAYQMSSRYQGEWKPEYELLFARHFVQRVGAEALVDSIIQVSNIPQRFTVNGDFPGGGVQWAMQLPQTRLTGGGTMVSFLDSFLRGNRIEEDRKGDGSVPQALNLMNDAFVHNRTRAAGTGPTASLARKLLDKYPAANNNLLVNEMFLTVLNRPVTEDELRLATASLTQGVRQQRVEDLLWALFNKVDFIYNY